MFSFTLCVNTLNEDTDRQTTREVHKATLFSITIHYLDNVSNAKHLPHHPHHHHHQKQQQQKQHKTSWLRLQKKQNIHYGVHCLYAFSSLTSDWNPNFVSPKTRVDMSRNPCTFKWPEYVFGRGWDENDLLEMLRQNINAKYFNSFVT